MKDLSHAFHSVKFGTTLTFILLLLLIQFSSFADSFISSPTTFTFKKTSTTTTPTPTINAMPPLTIPSSASATTNSILRTTQQALSSMSMSMSMSTSTTTSQINRQKSMNVAVIGAGAAGLAATRILTRNGITSVTVLEQQPPPSTSPSDSNTHTHTNTHTNTNTKTPSTPTSTSAFPSSTSKSFNSSLGGVWKYQHESLDNDKKDKPMYRGLRTNLPREIMRYREKPWGSNGIGKSYVTHDQVLDYLEEYAHDFDLKQYIQYGCQVTQLTVNSNSISLASPNQNKSSHSFGNTAQDGTDTDSIDRSTDGSAKGTQVDVDPPWPKITLEWITKTTNSTYKDTFDMVCICSGHYSLPSSPNIPGIEYFQGRIQHSIEYDDPTVYQNQTVLCIGGRASGADIAREISEHAKQVYLSDSAFPTEQNDVPLTQENVTWVPRTQYIEEQDQSIHFGTNCPIAPNDIDVIIFCSGYDYHFPFINSRSNLELSVIPGERRVGPLYKQLWHAQYPSLAFLGLPHSVIPFPLCEMQAEAITAQLVPPPSSSSSSSSSADNINMQPPIPLPNLHERTMSANADFHQGGPKHERIQDTHYLGRYQWDYSRDMAKIAGLYDDDMENYIATNKAIYDHSGQERKGIFPGGPDVYRETCYIRDDANQSFQIVSSEVDSTYTNDSTNSDENTSSSSTSQKQSTSLPQKEVCTKA